MCIKFNIYEIASDPEDHWDMADKQSWIWKMAMEMATIAYISIQAILSILGIGGVGGCWWLVASYSPLVQSCYDVWNGTQEMKILFMRKNFSS